MTYQDTLDAIELLDGKLRDTGCTLSTWCVRGSAVHKIQSAIRYLEAQLVPAVVGTLAANIERAESITVPLAPLHDLTCSLFNATVSPSRCTCRVGKRLSLCAYPHPRLVMVTMNSVTRFIPNEDTQCWDRIDNGTHVGEYSTAEMVAWFAANIERAESITVQTLAIEVM